MTSSLVGSEMCIRDRLKFIGVMITRAKSEGPEYPEGSYYVGQGKIQSVSYTHLTLPTICSV
eukprot:3423412-Prorocentrum_lima.AAC.1